MEDELKPCPFCGSEPDLEYNQGTENWGKSWGVKCNNCGASQGRAWGSNSWQKQSSETEALDANAKRRVTDLWNTRSEAS